MNLVFLHNHNCVFFFKSQKKMIKTGNAGIFAASLELAKDGNISIKQDNLFDEIFIKER